MSIEKGPRIAPVRIEHRYCRARLFLAALLLLAACSREDPYQRDQALWDSHMAVLDRHIASLRGEKVRNAPTQQELVRSLEFLQRVTGISAHVVFTPIGPIADLRDYVEAKRRWEDWRNKHRPKRD